MIENRTLADCLHNLNHWSNQMYISPEGTLPGRATSITSAQELAERQRKANDSLSELRNAYDKRKMLENDESVKALSPAVKEILFGGESLNISRPLDNARHNVCAFVLGVNQGIAKMFESIDKEQFRSMDVDKLTELSRETVELSKKFAIAFPMKSK